MQVQPTIIILAAGRGSRFGHPDLPKPLTLLDNGKTILGMQIESLRKLIKRPQIFVVVGYHKEKIMEQYPDLYYVYNPIFAQTNTAKSLLQAIKTMQVPILWLNGDVIFHPIALKKLLSDTQSTMLVNQSRTDEEAVKYRTDGRGVIVEVSKTVSETEGEALGINFFRKEDLPILIECLHQCGESDYFEKGIELAIQKGVEVKACVVEAHQCMEIDFSADLERANRLLQNF